MHTSQQQRQQLRGSQHQLHHTYQYRVRDIPDHGGGLNGFSPSPPPPPPVRHFGPGSAATTPYFYDRRLPPSPPPTAAASTMRQFSFTATLPRRSPPPPMAAHAQLPNGGMTLTNTLGRRMRGAKQEQ